MLGGAILGLATGALLGLLGGGGSIVAVPILVYVLGLEAKAAIGTSLIVVGLASLLAAWSHYRRSAVSVSTALVFGVTGSMGSVAGVWLAQLLPDAVQLGMFALAMGVVAVLMLRRTQPATDPAGDDRLPLFLVLASGFGAGLLTGSLGVGGGFIIVPVLTMLLRLPIREAIGTSLLVIAVNSIVGAVSYAPRLTLNASILPFAVGTLAAAPVAGRLAHFVPQDKLKVSFAISLLLLSVWMLGKQLFN